MRDRESKISLVPTEFVETPDDVQEMFNRMISLGKEGVIIKNGNEIWCDKRSGLMMKVKGEEEIDLRIVGLTEGTKGKVLGKLAAMEMASDDGMIRVSVGTGFSDEDRVTYLDNSYIGKIATIRYNMAINDKNRTEMSLFLPRFVEIRYDKDVTNTIEDIKS